MKRLVYSPSIKIWVKTDTGIIDLSPYVTSCNIERRIDDVSSATVEFRNPKINQNGKNRFMFTEHEVDGKVLPVFHPMDPITIILERIPGRPIQVFTGYCDTVPDVQLFPGTATIKASCTLKRLLYTFWDPALPFVEKFMKAYGWNLNVATGQAGTVEDTKDISKVNKLNDSSLGNLLYAVLNEIGGWDDSNIYIQPLPDGIANTVYKLFDEFTEDNKQINKEISEVIKKMVENGSYGSASAGGGGGGSNSGDIGIATEDVVTNDMSESALPWSSVGKASTYGSSHKYNYTDPGDDSYGSQPPASGADPDVPGIAVRRDIGHAPNYNWYVVRAPSGRAAAIPQTDWGPADSTGRVVDINTPAAVGVFGYSQSGGNNDVDFPTDQGIWKLYYCGQGSSGKSRAENIVRNGRL